MELSKIRSIYLLMFLTRISVVLGDCHGNWTHNPSNDQCYKYFPRHVTVNEASSACRQDGAMLPIIHSHEDNMFLLDYASIGRDNYNTPIHLPLSDVVDEAVWLWEDGSIPGWTNWRGALGDAGDCATLSLMDGTWADSSCASISPYVCVKQGCPTNWTLNSSTGQPQLYQDNTCYRWYSDYISQDDAMLQCADEGAMLPVVESAVDNEFITAFVRSQGTIQPFHLPYTKHMDGWVDQYDGTPIVWANWRDGVCAPGWTKREADNRCYRVYEVLKTYSKATVACEAEGAIIATPKSQAKNDYLVTLVQGSTNIWIPITEVQASWYWQDESPLQWSNWLPDRPEVDEWDCVRMNPSGTAGHWLQTSCSSSYRFVCEKMTSAPGSNINDDCVTVSPTDGLWNDVPCTFNRNFVCAKPIAASPSASSTSTSPTTAPSDPDITPPSQDTLPTVGQETDLCSYNPCQNGAVCSEIPNDYMCTCTEGFTDKVCSTAIKDRSESISSVATVAGVGAGGAAVIGLAVVAVCLWRRRRQKDVVSASESHMTSLPLPVTLHASHKALPLPPIPSDNVYVDPIDTETYESLDQYTDIDDNTVYQDVHNNYYASLIDCPYDLHFKVQPTEPSAPQDNNYVNSYPSYDIATSNTSNNANEYVYADLRLLPDLKDYLSPLDYPQCWDVSVTDSQRGRENPTLNGSPMKQTPEANGDSSTDYYLDPSDYPQAWAKNLPSSNVYVNQR